MATALGSSPCTQMVSICNGMRRPLRVMIAPSCSVRRTRSAAAVGIMQNRARLLPAHQRAVIFVRPVGKEFPQPDFRPIRSDALSISRPGMHTLTSAVIDPLHGTGDRKREDFVLVRHVVQ